MNTSRKCQKCSKTVLMMDPSVSAEGGIWHRECFKCSSCNGQLTLLNFAQIKGVLYCKPHFIELFKRRGKYDDIAPMAGENGEGETAAAPAPAPAAEPAAAPAPAPAPEPAPAPAPEPAPAAAPEPAPAPEPAAAPEPAPAPAPAPEPAPAAAPEPAPAPAPEPAASPAKAAATPSVSASEAASAASARAAAASTASSAPVPTRVVPAAAPAPAAADGAKPKFGGSSTKCASCTKTVYPADPQVSADGQCWHRECFKCTDCKGQLALTAWAQLDGQIFHKACFKKMFSARGRYDDIVSKPAAEPTA